jgi:hypothetical protein
MRRALLGSLTCVALLAAAPAIAGDVPPQAAGADTTHVDPISKAVKPAKTRPAPLSAAAAYEATRTDLPAAPLHARTSAPAASDTPWTGFHVGVSAGMAR